MEDVKVFGHCHLLHNHNGTHLYGRYLSVTNVDRKLASVPSGKGKLTEESVL